MALDKPFIELEDFAEMQRKYDAQRLEKEVVEELHKQRLMAEYDFLEKQNQANKKSYDWEKKIDSKPWNDNPYKDPRDFWRKEAEQDPYAYPDDIATLPDTIEDKPAVDPIKAIRKKIKAELAKAQAILDKATDPDHIAKIKGYMAGLQKALTLLTGKAE